MKKSKLLQKLFAVTILLLLPLLSNGQWQTQTNFDRSWVTDNFYSISAVGIGDYIQNNDWPKAALDICIPYLTPTNGDWEPNGTLSQGEAIHTSAVSDFDHAWRMYTFNHHPGTEKFHILNPSTSNDIHLNVVQRGFLELYTDNTHYGRLREQGFFGLSDYWSGGPFPNFTPLSMVHLNQINPSFPNPFVQFTNTNTGWGSITEGFKVGIELNQNYPGPSKTFAMLIQYENAPMKFYTNAVDRMIINADYNPTIHQVPVNTTGYVGIGLPNFWNEENGGEGPRSLLHLQGDYIAFVNSHPA